MRSPATDLRHMGLRGGRRLYLRAVVASIRPFSGVLRKLGVDVDQLALLLRVRFAVVLRASRSDAGIGASVGLWVALLGLLTIGLLIGIVSAAIPSAFWAQALVQAAVLGFVTLGMLQETPTLFGDDCETALVLPTPVDGRTLLAARVAHAGVTLTTMTTCTVCLPLLFGAVRRGPLVWIPSTLVATACSAVLATGAVVLLYLFALRVFGAHRFRSLVAWVQLGVLGSMYVMTYSVPALLRDRLPDGWLEMRPWWLCLLPPAWAGGLQDVMGGGDRGPIAWTLAALLLGAPLVVITLGLLAARGGFLRAMSSATVGGGAQGSHRKSISMRLARVFTRPGAERSGFLLFASLAPRESGYRLRALPMYLMLCAMGIGSVLRSGVDPDFVSIALYALLLGMPVLIVTARYSEQPDANWVATANLGESDRRLARGSRKGAWVLGLLLPAVILAPVLLALAGSLALTPLAFAFTSTVAVGLAFLFVPTGPAPFARRYERQSAGDVLTGYFGAFAATAFLGFAQFGLAEVPLALPIGAGLCALIAALLWRRL